MSSVKNTETVTKTQSFTLVKNMFRLAVSSICYLRNIFPEDCFKKTSYGGQSVHQLQCAEMTDEGDLHVLNEDAFLLSQWLERSVFDALEKGYMQSMTFMVYRKDAATQEVRVLETYTFHVQYPGLDYDDGYNGAIKVNDTPVTLENTKLQAIGFIRCLVEFASTLDVLPEDRWLTLKLTYYDDRTPLDYEPMFFSSVTDEDNKKFSLKKGAIKIRIGKLGTSHHQLSLSYAGFDSFLDECIVQPKLTNPPNRDEAHDHSSKDNDDDDFASPAAVVTTPPTTSGGASSRAQPKTTSRKRMLCAPSSSSDCAVSSTGTNTTKDKVRDYVLREGVADVRQCATALSFKIRDIRAAFELLIKDGVLTKTSPRSHQKITYTVIAKSHSASGDDSAMDVKEPDSPLCDETQREEELGDTDAIVGSQTTLTGTRLSMIDNAIHQKKCRFSPYSQE